MNKQILFLLSFIMLSMTAFPRKINGKVVEKGNIPLPGVSIKIENNAGGTISDIDGNFELDVQDNSTLIFTYIGYSMQKILIGKRDYIKVELDPSSKLLDEVVAIGYSTVKKKDLTGAVSVVNMKDAINGSKNSITDVLQGRIAGVSVKTSAAPGDKGQIFMRGVGSFYTSSNPLFVIDGIPTDDSNSFNPNDIESIQVLKDASAAAIYGSRAFNGVIIVTTKQGKKGEKKIDFTYRTNNQIVQRPFEVMETEEWLKMHEAQYKNAYGAIYLKKMPIVKDSTVNTDWYKQALQIGTQNEYDFAISGSSKDQGFSYRASTNYLKQNGIVIGTDYSRFNARINTTWDSKWFKLSENLLFSNSQAGTAGGGGAWAQAAGLPPTLPVYDVNGNYALGDANSIKEMTGNSNLVAQRDKTFNMNKNYHVMASVSVEVPFTSWLKYRLNLGTDLNFNINNTQSKVLKTNLRDYDRSSISDLRGINENYLMEHLLEFNKTINNNSINALVGYTEQYFSYNTTNIVMNDVLVDQNGKYYFTLSNATSVNNTSQDIEINTLRSYLGRITYNYDQRYYFTGSLRTDGSSRFSIANRYGYFPSVSLAWRTSKEKFFNIPFIDDFKIRGSYGELGNQEIGNWLYSPYLQSNLIYMFGNNEKIDYSGKSDQTIVDQNIKWEQKISSNIGFDTYLFNNKLGITFDYYYNKNVDLLAYVSIPYYTGNTPANLDPYSKIMTNAGSVANSGFELSINYKEKFSKDFYSDITLNLSTVNNKVLALGGTNTYIPADVAFNVLTHTEVGRSIGEWYLLKSNGIYQVNDPDLNKITVLGKKAIPGDYKYIDMNGDGDINDQDRVFCGSPWPTMEYSLQWNLGYKAFDLSMFLYGNIGRKVYNSLEYSLTNTSSVDGNFKRGLFNVSWSPENPNNKYSLPRAGSSIISYTDRYLQDGSFLRFGNIQLGYDLNSINIIKKLNINKFRIYVSAENIFTITNYTGWNVDFKGSLPFLYGYDGNTYPVPLNIQGGFQFSF
ncbi:MAG: TonB-dependent receptor [Bacteroidales bacterium]|nr:TonB-dependent receptor [Bacteroidales bacterium]